MSGNVAPRIVTDNLILYIDAGNENSYVSGGTSCIDLSKMGNNSSLINGPTFNSANGGSIVFDGINEYINCNNLTKELFKNNEYCVDVWMKMGGVDRGDIFNIKEFISLPFNIRHDIGAYIQTNNRVQVWTRIDTILNPIANSVGSITRGTPFCFTLTVDKFGRISIYFNGLLDNNTTVLTSSLLNIIDNVGSDFWIFSNRSTPTTPNFALNGNLYSFKLYNRALSNQEVLQNYNATKIKYL